MAFVLAAHEHSCAVSHDGQLYSWGRCTDDTRGDAAGMRNNDATTTGRDGGGGTPPDLINRLGLGDDLGDKDVPTLVRGALANKRVVGVSGSAHVTAAVTSDGLLFAWGRGGDGALGVGDTSSKNSPTLVQGSLRGKRVVAVSAAGDAHVAALTSEGEVYTWGRGLYLQLGHGNDDDTMHPTRVGGCLRGKKVVAVSVNSDYSAAVTADGLLFTWGGGRLFGRLGHGDPVPRPVPTPVTRGLKGKRVTNVSLGTEHAAALCHSGELFTWGDGRHGKLGLGHETESFVATPVRGLLKGKRVGAVSAGTHHTAAITLPDGVVYTWGWGKDGRLGHGGEESASLPTAVEAVSRYLRGCTAVSAGYDHTVAISVSGELLTWGGDPDKVSKLGLGLSFGSAFIRMDPCVVKMPEGFRGWRTEPFEDAVGMETGAGAGNSSNAATADAVADDENGNGDDTGNAKEKGEARAIRRTPRGVDGIEPGYNPATATVARLREVAFTKKDTAATTAIRLPSPSRPNVTAAAADTAAAAAATAAAAAAIAAADDDDDDDDVTAAAAAPPLSLPPERRARDSAPHHDTPEEQGLKKYAKLLAKAIRRDGSFMEDIRGVDDGELALVRDILERLCFARDAARDAIDSEMSVRALTETVLRDHPHFACPLSRVLMRDPVVAADGHSYERREIERHFASGSRVSPAEGDALSGTGLIPNRNLKNEIERAMAAALGESTDAGASGGSGRGSGGSKESLHQRQAKRPRR